MEPSVYVQSDISSKLKTYPMLDGHPPAFRVTWIAWDSGFRGSGLLIGDEIIAVNGTPVTRPDKLEDIQRMLPQSIGQYAEAQRWAASGAKEGDPLRLTVRRRNYPGVGWRNLDITGTLRADRIYTSDGSHRIYGPGGPPEMFESDGFGSSWSAWYDQGSSGLLSKLSYILDGGLEQRSINSRYELQQLLEAKPRVDFLLERYPGPFADAVKADWEAAHNLLLGRRYELTAEDLDYRRAQEEKVSEVAKQAQAGWQQFQEAHAAETIPTFPAVDPLHGDRAKVVGKCVVLPPISERQWISEAGHNWFTAGNDGDGWYFADAESPEALRMLIAVERYRKLVSPNIRSGFVILGRILPNPRLVVINDRGIFGLQVEILGALVDDAAFVDVTRRDEAGRSRFAGEDAFLRSDHPPPPDTASPTEVIEALIAAVKLGDQVLFNSLFAGWSVTFLEDGRPVFHPYFDRGSDSDWEYSRRNLLDKVYAVRVVWTGEVRALTSGKEFPGAPVIEEVVVEVEHVGSFEGEYRPFVDINVNRLWHLRRRDGGPWRIGSSQYL